MNIKRAIFKLNKITGKTDLHTDIMDTTTKFDVIPGVISYARLPLLNKKGPLTLTFRYSKGQDDLSACLSQVKLLPDQMNCQVHRQKPHTLEVRTLTNDFLYISLETQKGACFTVEVKFNEYRNTSSRVSYRSPAVEKMATLPVIEELPYSAELINMNRTNSSNWLEIRKIKTVK